MASDPSPSVYDYQSFDTVLINRGDIEPATPSNSTSSTENVPPSITSNGAGTPAGAAPTSEAKITTPPPPPIFKVPSSPHKRGVFGYLVPMNTLAKESIRKLATEREREDTRYHRQFLDRAPAELGVPPGSDCFILSLDKLPESPQLGWRIGKGRRKLRNWGVDFLLPVSDSDTSGAEDVGGLHARLSWIKGGGGFFLIADNQRGLPVNLNGESLSYSQRLIPYHNSLLIGQLLFSIKFLSRTQAQEEEFQSQLLLMYSAVLRESTPFIMPTPSRDEVRVGEWVLRKPLGRGSFGSVSSVTNVRTGRLAALKEIWRTPRNSVSVDREVEICRKLREIPHKRLATPFDIKHETIYNSIEKARIMALLDSTWHPTLNIPIDKYTLYSPLATSNFHSLITSAASLKTRTRLFAQVLEGLAFLHSQRIAHRDIKPGNLAVITFDPPVAQILDFGCAAFIPAFFSSSDSSEASASAPSPEASSLPPGTCPSARGRGKLPYANEGTIPYLAPEQVPGRYHNESVDLWAAALVGLEILRYRLRGRVLEAEYGRIHEWLDDYERIPRRTGLASAVRGMLRWGPEERGCALGVGEMWFADLDMRDVEGVNGDGKRGGGDTVHEREGGLKKNSFSEMALKDMG